MIRTCVERVVEKAKGGALKVVFDVNGGKVPSVIAGKSFDNEKMLELTDDEVKKKRKKEDEDIKLKEEAAKRAEASMADTVQRLREVEAKLSTLFTRAGQYEPLNTETNTAAT